MLKAKGLAYSTGNKTILHNINLEVQAGEVFALTGPNGAGKTTLLRLLSGDLQPDSGTVELDNRPLSSYSRRDLALKRAVMSQKAFINFDFTVKEIVMQGRHPHIRLGETDADRLVVADVMAKTETDHLHHRFYPSLSGGEQSRVTFARILAQETTVLLLDEPTSMLDLRHQQLVMILARELAEEGKTVVVIVHDLNLAATHADRIGMLKAGELVGTGTPAEMLTETMIQDVFNLSVLVIEHPTQPTPLIVPMPPPKP